jgi:hypothetical protein
MFSETNAHGSFGRQYLLCTFGSSSEPKQGWLIPPTDPAKLPELAVAEPTRKEQPHAETELFGFAVSGHPLELFNGIAWDTYCPANRLGEFVGQTVYGCGLVVEQRVHQITGAGLSY